MRYFLFVCVLTASGPVASSGAPPYYLPPDQIMRAAGYDIDHATSKPAKWDDSGGRPRYCVTYFFGRSVVYLGFDPQTSQTVEISGAVGRSTKPTSPTGSLTSEWARQMLVRMNVLKVRQGAVFVGVPEISYHANWAEYSIFIPRTDGQGHRFEDDGVGFWFDQGTSCVTSLWADLDLPEPAVTTGTMISEAEATSRAISGLNSRKSVFFRYVPDKMAFRPVLEPLRVLVVRKDNMFDPALKDIDDKERTSGTAVAYVLKYFESQMTDPSYTGTYEYVKVIVYVDVFSGELVGGDYAKEIVSSPP